MYCLKCGNQIDDDSVFCTRCGAPVEKEESVPETAEEVISEPRQESAVLTAPADKVNVWLCILSALIPVVGLIFFILWRNERPRRAIICGICALEMAVVWVLAGAGFGIYFGVTKSNTDNNKYAPGLPGIIYPNFPSQAEKPDRPPEEAVYKNSSDGVLGFTYFVGAKNICYDNKTDSVIVWNSRKVIVYSRTDNSKLHTFDYTLSISDVCAYNGVLAVGFGDYAMRISIIDLQSGESRTVSTQIDVCELAITDGYLVFCEDDQWCELYVLNLNNNSQSKLSERVYQPKLAFNHEKKVLYIVETGISSSDFFMIDVRSMRLTELSEFGDYSYNYQGVYFDGEYVHAFGNTYDSSGGMVANRGYAESVSSNDEYLLNTLCNDGNYAFITTYDNKTVVYDLKDKRIVYTLKLAATEIYHVGGNIFIAFCGDSGYVGHIDLSKI